LREDQAEFLAHWKPRARAAWRTALDLVLPPQTLDGGPRPLAGGFSAETWSRIHFLDGPVCDGCGAPFPYATGDRCAACLAQPHAFDAARAACLYDETSREPILQLKPRQHRAGWDVTGLENELAHPQGHSQGDQHAAPEGPGALAFRVGACGVGPIGGCRVVWGLG
jgi:hypothetical protein